MSTKIVQSGLQVISQAKGDATLTQASLAAIGRASGVKINQVTADLLKRNLEPSVRIASIYFKVEQVSLREVFNKAGRNSLIELIENE